MRKLCSLGIGISLVLASALNVNASTVRYLTPVTIHETDPVNDATPNASFEINNVSISVSDLSISVIIDTNVSLTGVPWGRARDRSVGWADVFFNGDNGKNYAVRFGNSDFHNPSLNLNTTGVYSVSDTVSVVARNNGSSQNINKPTHADGESLLIGNLNYISSIQPLNGISRYRHSFSFDSALLETGTYDVTVALECYNDFLDMVVPVTETSPSAYIPPVESKPVSVPESSNLVALAGLGILGLTLRQKTLK